MVDTAMPDPDGDQSRQRNQPDRTGHPRKMAQPGCQSSEEEGMLQEQLPEERTPGQGQEDPDFIHQTGLFVQE